MRPANGGVAPVPGRVSEEFPAVVSIGHIEDDRHARCDPVVHGLALPVRHLGDIAVGIIVARITGLKISDSKPWMARTDAARLVLQPDFVIFMGSWLAAGSGRF